MASDPGKGQLAAVFFVGQGWVNPEDLLGAMAKRPLLSAPDGAGGEVGRGGEAVLAGMRLRVPETNVQGGVLAQYLDDNPTGTASDTYAIGLTITDDHGGVGAAD